MPPRQWTCGQQAVFSVRCSREGVQTLTDSVAVVRRDSSGRCIFEGKDSLDQVRHKYGVNHAQAQTRHCDSLRKILGTLGFQKPEAGLIAAFGQVLWPVVVRTSIGFQTVAQPRSLCTSAGGSDKFGWFGAAT